MNVVDIMTHEPITTRVDTSLDKIMDCMAENNIRHLPVMNPSGQMVGIISDRDCRLASNSPYLSREFWKAKHAVKQLTASMFMTPAPITVDLHAPAVDVARLMVSHHIGCLPVMRDETLVGIVTRSDVLTAFMRMYEYFTHNSDTE